MADVGEGFRIRRGFEGRLVGECGEMYWNRHRICSIIEGVEKKVYTYVLIVSFSTTDLGTLTFDDTRTRIAEN